ncbi:hypothetical protein PUN28_009331 [Cardiocondyla obscurior]|uniref:Uncharacterized protein n=1 Tax=Cardiocondyla obscurior TaxID=286306 RepID=A0AAW2FTT4_9HYME
MLGPDRRALIHITPFLLNSRNFVPVFDSLSLKLLVEMSYTPLSRSRIGAFVRVGGDWRARRKRKFAIARERNMRIMPRLEKRKKKREREKENIRPELVTDLYVATRTH